MPPTLASGVVLAGTVVAILMLVMVLRHRKRRASTERTKVAGENSVPPSETIFVNLASFRDPECAQTIYSLFSTAASPTRIWVGLLDQSYDHDPGILQEYARMCRSRGTYDYSNQIRRHPMLPSRSRGHIACRALIDKFLRRNEKYHLTIDSHTMFTRNWDTHVCDELNALISPECPHPVLTMEPPPYNVVSRVDPDLFNQEPAFFMSCEKRVKKGYRLPAIHSESLQHVPDRPVPSTFWSGAFSFTRSRTARKVPFDPLLSYVHTEECIYMAARFFTHGCDLYCPTRAYVASMRDNSSRHLVFDNFSATQMHERSRAYKRMHLLLGMGPQKATTRPAQKAAAAAAIPDIVDAHIYGLGTMRSLERYFNYCGLDWSGPGACRIKAQAHLGITAIADHQELMAKHGVLYITDDAL